MLISEAIELLEQAKKELGDLPLYTYNIDNLIEKVESLSLCQRTLNEGGNIFGVQFVESEENLKRRIWKMQYD